MSFHLRRTTRVALAGLTTAAVLAGCGGSSLDDGDDTASDGGSPGSGGSSEPVDIGLLVPKSGVYAPIGEDMEQGFQLYLDQNEGQLGGREVNLQVVDEGGGPDTGVPAAQQLVQSDVDAVVGVVNSAIALGVKDLFEESQTPLIVANAGADDITGAAASDYVWRTAFGNGDVAAALGPQVAESCESTYLLGADYAAGKEHVGGFKQAYEEAGGAVAGETYTPFGTTTNYQPFLAQVQQSNADCVFVFYAGAEAVAFVKQFQELGLKDAGVQLYGSGFLTEGGVLEAQGESAVGVETSLHYSTEIDSPRNEEFVQAYTDAYGEDPTVYAVQAYDAAQVLDQALEEGVEGEQIVAGLQGIDTVDSPRGEFSFTEGHGPDQTYYHRRVEMQDGKLVNTVVGELE